MNLELNCPYHADERPSLSVDPDKGVWVCHACKRSGLTYDLARDLGLSKAAAMDREAVRQVLASRSTGTSTSQALGLPSMAVHGKAQIAAMWGGAHPARFGVGYALTRVPAELLQAFGVDYVSGLLLFRKIAALDGEHSESIGQVREACAGGQYFSIGERWSLARVWFDGVASAPRTTIFVEGPFDGLRLVEAIGLSLLRRHRISVGCCGGATPEQKPEVAHVFSMFDNDAAGDRMREVTPWAISLPYVGEDPGAVDAPVLARQLISTLWNYIREEGLQ